ncbi:hypothetical protein CXB51_033303 [Gossypium anomalum]|uniref:PP2A regulatory subunit TAP46 n=1 Tax=Gossypium anomalum TaxID=47600 RepID=A0A8J5Y443_9ROSI|nr:hypothetical protein CXB51_033303 [Gossypium anomalum]
MCESKMEDMPLPAFFEQANKIHLTATESGADQDLVKKGCEALGKCEDMISKLGLFSSNETKDDISTTNLKYILVPFYLAELTEKIVQDDRIQILKTSQAKLKEFMSFCEAMELVPQEELEVAEYIDLNGNSVVVYVLFCASNQIDRAAEAKLTEIKERKERRKRSTKAAAISTPVEHGEEDVLDDDGEEEREAWLTTISLAICKEGEKEFSLAMLDDRTKKAEAWHRDAETRARYTKPAPPITCATFDQDVIEGKANVSQAHDHKHEPIIFGPQSLIGGSFTSERERMAAQVFQPFHRMPTMSIEGAGLKEMEMMNKWQERNAKMFEEANSAWYKDRPKLGLSEHDEDDDTAQEKARAWDDWKDDNPRGAGNKKLTPCG